MQCSGGISGKRLEWRRRLQCRSTAAAPCAVPLHKRHCAASRQHKRTLSADAPIGMTPKLNAQLHDTAWYRGPKHHAAAAMAATPAAGAPVTSAAICAGDVLVLRCERLGFGGKGISLAPPSGLVVMVDRALPGELMRVQITAVKKGYAEAAKLETLEPHADAAEPACQHFGTCGGCTLQNLDYNAQLAHKAAHVQQLLARVGKVPAEQLAGICRAPVGAPYDQLYNYRNKTQFTFAASTWVPGGSPEVVAAPALGFLRPGSNDVVLPIAECHLQHPIANDILASVRQECQRQGLAPHDPVSDSGVMRHLIIRSAGPYTSNPSSGSQADPGSSSSSSSNARPSASNGSSTTHANGRRVATGSSNAAQSSNTPNGAARFSRASDNSTSGYSAGVAFMVVLVTTAAADERSLQAVAQALTARHPQVASVVWSIEAGSSTTSSSGSGGRRSMAGRGGRGRARQHSSSSSSSGVGCREASRHASRALQIASSRVLFGEQQLMERLCGLDFAISPHSFFQTNSRQAEVLYRLVAEAANLAPGGTDVLLDLYCGTGTIGLSMAHECAAVVGVDVTPSSIADARANAAANGIRNATFHCADLDKLCAAGGLEGVVRGAESSSSSQHQHHHNLQQQQEQQQQKQQHTVDAGRVDVVIADPARAGMGESVVAFLRACGARRLVYVSCNAATLARDVERLCRASADTGGVTSGTGQSGDRAFQLASVLPVDLFPHTDHIEAVAVLHRLGDV